MNAHLTTPVRSPIIVGRALPIAHLEFTLQQAQDGRGQVVILAGEAGIGKSRLVAALVEHAQTQEFFILEGNCFEPDRPLPFAPLLDLLRNFLLPQSPEIFTDQPAAFAPDLGTLLPEIARYLPANHLPTPEPAQEKKRLFQAIYRCLTLLNPNHSRLVILEDLHWSDETSLEFLYFFARQIRTAPVLLVLTYRSDETNPALDHFLAQLDRERIASEIGVTPLNRVETEEMIRAIFNLQQPVRGEFLDRIADLAEGNPYIVEEILKSLVATGEIYHVNGVWERKPIRDPDIPRSVQDAVRRRIAQLHSKAQDVLALAAVVGRRFDFVLLQELTRMNESELTPLLKQLIGAQLIAQESADTFLFRHALTREVVYSELLIRERKVLHLRVSNTLEQRYADAADAHVADLAYHFYAAEEWTKALEYSELAGEQAARMYAQREAIEQFTRAIRAAEKLAHPSRAKLYRARGQARETMSEFEEARADFEQALALVRAANDARGEWQALLDLGFSWAARDYTRTGEYFQEALALARALNDPPMLARTLNRVGNWYVNIEQPHTALDYHREALEIFQTLEDRPGLAETFDLLGLASEELGNGLDTAKYYGQAIALLRELDDRVGLASSLSLRAAATESYFGGVAIPAPGTLAEALAWGEESERLARETGWRSGEVFALGGAALLLGAYGDYTPALTRAHKALEMGKEIEHRGWIAMMHAALGWLHMDLLGLEQAQRHFEQGLELANLLRSPIFIHLNGSGLASVCTLQKNLTKAETVLMQSMGDWVVWFGKPGQSEIEESPPSLSLRLCLAALVELELARANPERALEILDRMLDTTPNLTPRTVIPRLWGLRSQAFAQLGQLAEAEQLLLAACEDARARNLRPILWRLELALGKLYQRQDRRKAADAEYTAARAIVVELADDLADTAIRENFLAVANDLLPHPRTLTPHRAEKERYGGLTTREREIAALIADGKSNREIAEKLVLSERTVITHVTSILGKLGFTSRTQVAVWATESGLGSPPHTPTRN